MVHKGYEFRIYPNKEQKIMFAKTFGSVRFVYNHFLELWNTQYELTKRGLSYKKCSAMLPSLKASEKTSFLKKIDAIALQSSLKDLADAFNRFFNRQNKMPVFKSRAMNQSYTTKNVNNNLFIKNSYIKLPKIGLVKIVDSFNFNHRIIKATIRKTASNKYFFTVLVEEKIKPMLLTGSKVGIDIGLNDFVVTSEGTKYENVIILDHLIKNLKREQIKLSRRYESAKERGVDLRDARNYQKQKIVVARIYEKIKDIVNDYTNKLSTKLIKNHDLICIESLNVENMLKNKYLSKSNQRLAISNFVRKLEYKAKWYGKEIVKVNTYYPSSQICSSCGSHEGKKALHIRKWTCSKCNETHDRDINASINILNEGLRIFNSI